MTQVINFYGLSPRAARIVSPKAVALKDIEGTRITCRTSSRRFPVNYNGLQVYTSHPCARGNSKLGANIAIFDLLAIHTCGNCRDCAKSCYAMKAQRQYKNTFNKRAINTYLAANDTDYLAEMLLNQLSRSNVPYVRIHSSGDFFNNRYVEMWEFVARTCAEKKFYFYTKMDGILDMENLINLPNVNRVKSILPDGSINFGSMEYILEKSRKFGIKICPYGISDKPIKCGTDCTVCMEEEYCLFLEH